MDYITCLHTKSQYKVSVAVCRHCKRMHTCAGYQAYLQPSLFPRASEITIKATARKKHSRTTGSKISDLPHKPEQFTLDL